MQVTLSNRELVLAVRSLRQVALVLEPYGGTKHSITGDAEPLIRWNIRDDVAELRELAKKLDKRLNPNEDHEDA